MICFEARCAPLCTGGIWPGRGCGRLNAPCGQAARRGQAMAKVTLQTDIRAIKATAVGRITRIMMGFLSRRSAGPSAVRAAAGCRSSAKDVGAALITFQPPVYRALSRRRDRLQHPASRANLRP